MTLSMTLLARRAARAGTGCLFFLCGCAQQPVHVAADHFDAVTACADDATTTIAASASVLPIGIPPELASKGTLQTTGTVARRLTLAFAPGSLKPGESFLWSRAFVRTLGGTVEGWTRLQSDGVLIEVAAPAPAQSHSTRNATEKHAAREQAAVESGPGYITVDRASPTGARISNTLSVDLLILPGGIPIDEPVVHVSELWSADGKPLPPSALRFELVPTHHAPGYDVVEADVKLDFVLSRDRDGLVCKGSAQARTTIVDRDAVRAPFWDLGVSSLNAPRSQWLALSDPASGIFRAVFDSPATATSFANWIRATGSAQAGPYQLGLFQQDGRKPLRPLAPVDRGALDTFRVLTREDIQALRTGPLGEP